MVMVQYASQLYGSRNMYVVQTPCSSLLAAARSVLEVEAESMDGVPGRLPVLELPADPRPPPRLGGVRFF